MTTSILTPAMAAPATAPFLALLWIATHVVVTAPRIAATVTGQAAIDDGSEKWLVMEPRPWDQKTVSTDARSIAAIVLGVPVDSLSI